MFSLDNLLVLIYVQTQKIREIVFNPQIIAKYLKRVQEIVKKMNENLRLLIYQTLAEMYSRSAKNQLTENSRYGLQNSNHKSRTFWKPSLI